jgi:hypothetical protein
MHARANGDPIDLDPLRRPAVPGGTVEQQPSGLGAVQGLATVTKLARTTLSEQARTGA